MGKFNLYDIQYDVTTQDWAVDTGAGDLAEFNGSYEDILSGLLIDAMESSFDSMKYILPKWGFEGRDDDYTTEDNEVYQRAYLYISEIFGALGFLLLNIRAVTPDFPGTSNTFSVEIEAVLNDIYKTEYHKTLTWDGATQRASIS